MIRAEVLDAGGAGAEGCDGLLAETLSEGVCIMGLEGGAIDKLSVVITLVLAFVLLHEDVSVKAVAGCVLIGAGTLVMVL